MPRVIRPIPEDPDAGPSGVNDRSSIISQDAPGVVEVDGVVELFIEDKEPRGERFLEVIMGTRDSAEAFAANQSVMFVLNNEEEFEARTDNPTPEDFNQAFTVFGVEPTAIIAWLETLIADYEQGQDDLESFMQVGPIAEDIGGSKAAMKVINEGDEFDQLQDYRL